MRRAVPLAALPLLAAGAAAPAAADYPPTDCAVTLTLAAAGEWTGCNTIGVAPVPTGNNRRVVTVYAQTGQATAALTCGGESGAETVTVTATAPWSASATLDRTGFCWLKLTATVDGTTAVAVNRSGQTVK